jgi:hypothetical protein
LSVYSICRTWPVRPQVAITLAVCGALLGDREVEADLAAALLGRVGGVLLPDRQAVVVGEAGEGAREFDRTRRIDASGG